MVVFYTFSVVVVVVVVVGGEGVDAGKREGGEAVGEAVGCGRRGVGDGGEGVDDNGGEYQCRLARPVYYPGR